MKTDRPVEIIMMVKTELSLTPENAKYMRAHHDKNSTLINRLIEANRIDSELKFMKSQCVTLSHERRE